MKSFVALLAVVAVVAADVSHVVGNSEAAATITKQTADVFPDKYEYFFQTSNGISGQESGSLQPGPDGSYLISQGSNSHTAPDGQQYSLSWTADENGYHPQGAHLPTPPPPQPIPDYILRSLEYIAAHPPKDETLRRV